MRISDWSSDVCSSDLLFVEHGLAPDPGVRRWQDRLTPAWKRIGGGCHLNRPIRSLIEAGAFDIMGIETGYAQGPRPMTFMSEGRARPGSPEGTRKTNARFGQIGRPARRERGGT